jgi:diguanylate cyclase (GGDEF)-like protein
MATPLISIKPDESVGRAAFLMQEYGVGGLPVIDAGQLVGIITSRDIRGVNVNRLVADAMTGKVITASPDLPLLDATILIEEHDIERLVITTSEGPVGIVTRARLLAEAGKHIDALTGLAKAGYVQGKANELLQQGKDVSIIFLDLDNFGVINKELGHVVGDEVLRKAAAVFHEIVDENTGFLCRYAGDEFAVVTTKPLTDAEKLAMQLLVSLERETWPNNIEVKASVGIATGRHNCDSDPDFVINELINMASLASTEAKLARKPIVLAGQPHMDQLTDN